MMPSTVCFGARDDWYGFFRTSKAGNIITFKLTYKSGYVTCDARKSSFHSKWGCLWNRLIPNQMATLITDKNRNLLLPKSDFLSDYRDCKFYSLPWATTESPQLHFDKNSKSGTARTCSNGVMAIMGTKKRVLQCMVCMFELSPKLGCTLKKRVPKIVVHAFITSILHNYN